MRLTAAQVAEPQYQDKPLWCVHGYKFSPKIFPCKINSVTGVAVIWGYSEYANSPKYRTMGVNLSTWAANETLCEFYDIHDEAIERVKKLTTTKKIKS